MDIIETWKEKKMQDNKNNAINSDAIKAIIRKKVDFTDFSIKINIIVYAIFGFIALITSLINITVSQNKTVDIIIISYMIFFLLYGGIIFRKHLFIKKKDIDLQSHINNKLSFLKGFLSIWFVLFGITVNMFVFAVSFATDQVNGIYKINSPYIYLAISVFIIAIIYISNKFALKKEIEKYEMLKKQVINGELPSISKKNLIILVFAFLALITLIAISLILTVS